MAVGRPNASLSGWFRCRNRLAGRARWTNGSTITIPHTIYASRLHRDLHFQIIARDIIGYISSPVSVVLDYACGEALSAARWPTPVPSSIYGRARPRCPRPADRALCAERKIRVRSLEDLTRMTESSVDLVVMNSVAQYMTPKGWIGAGRRSPAIEAQRAPGAGRHPAAGSRHGQGRPALLKFARTHGFLKDALYGLASTALSDYRRLRARVGLQRYGENEMIEKLARAGFSTSRAQNIGHNPGG